MPVALLPCTIGWFSCVRCQDRLARCESLMFQSSLPRMRLSSRSPAAVLKEPGLRPSPLAASMIFCRSPGDTLLLVEAPLPRLSSRALTESPPRPVTFSFSYDRKKNSVSFMIGPPSVRPPVQCSS
jgi:hypothetical protein